MMVLEAVEASDRDGTHEYRDAVSIGMGILREKPSCALWKSHKDTDQLLLGYYSAVIQQRYTVHTYTVPNWMQNLVSRHTV